MTIKKIIEDLEKLNEEYLETARDLNIKREIRKYFQGKYRGIKTVINYLKCLTEDK